MKLLIGGSPCTYWSISQTKNRETEASGMGWELFRNYAIARDKMQPDYFLYENNKSMSPKIRAQITELLGVEPVLINSALVSAQNRQRLYWCGKREADGTYSKVEIEQPEDRGNLLRDVLESGVIDANYWKSPGQVGFDTQAGRRKMVAEPVCTAAGGKSFCVTATEGKGSTVAYTLGKHKRTLVAEPVCVALSRMAEKSNCLTTGCAFYEYCGTIDKPIYQVKDGLITIKGEQYSIKLRDGCYIIRKLTVRECMRLQTVPENYEFPVSDAQAYKMLGNGWTVDVIVHLLSHFDGIKDEPVDVLSMYDGMACGHIALDKLGVTIRNYFATEIDKYAIKTATHNFPDIVELGDAFQVRDAL